MVAPRSNGITTLLKAWHRGEPSAFEELAPAVERELRRIAGCHLRRERAGHTLEPPDLVNEVFLRLIEGGETIGWQDRAHFYAIAARVMRRVLIEHARRKQASKRRGWKVTLDGAMLATADSEQTQVELLALNQAMEQLECLDERKARVVELRYFAGLDNRAIAELLGISVATVKRDWRMARAWLHRAVAGEQD